MQNLVFSANIVLPLFLLILLGLALKKIGWITDGFLDSADKLVFKLFLPSVLFNSLYSAQLHSTANIRLAAYSLPALAAVNLIAFIVVLLCIKDNARRGTLIQAMTRSNYILFAIPICQAAYGSAGVVAVSVLAAVFVPISNLFAVVALSVYNANGRSDFKSMLLSIIKNPFIIASLSAICVNLAGIKFPLFVSDPLQTIAAMATPFALMVLGAQIRFSRVKNNLAAIIFATAMKLVLLPAIVLAGAYCAGLRGLDFMVVLATFCSPIAVSTYLMAKMMGCDEELAAQTIVSTTLLSIFTIFAFLFFSRALGII